MAQLRTSQKVQQLIDLLNSVSFSSSASRYSTSYEKAENKDEKEKYYITTAINYTNGRPHIGHAYEAVVTDIIARYHRTYGRDVFFLTGTDEHGQKVANTAQDLGKTPKQLCDENVQHFKDLNQKLLISNDYFVRTTDKNHYKLAQKMFQYALDKNDIYKGIYKGWYNEREECFISETDARNSDYKDAMTGKKLEQREEACYFFKMSKYQSQLINFLQNNPQFIQPINNYNLIMTRLEKPLEDLCVSRSTFNWGVPLPHDKEHVMYVWFDALTNYLSGIDYFNFEHCNKSHYWPADVHVIGRDIVWFHTVIWPCILFSCDIPLPKSVYCHGFVTDAQGTKMSKSLGNVINPFDMLNKYDVDTIRYFIASQGSFGEDIKWNIKDLEERHDAHLTYLW